MTLKPSRATLRRPSAGVQQFDLAYRQQYRAFADGMWLPVDFHIAIDMELGLTGLQFPYMRRDIIQRLSAYRVNQVLPDSLFGRKQIEEPTRTEEDSLFTHFQDAVPLSSEERQAFAEIDSSVSLLEAFKPSGFLARFMPAPMPAEASDQATNPWRLTPSVRANRVDAAYLGGEVERTLSESLDARLQGGYSAGHSRWAYGGGLQAKSVDGTLSLDVAYQSDVSTRYRSHNFGRGFNSVQVLLGADDYFDYLWNRRLSTELRLGSAAHDLVFAFGLQGEEHRSLRVSSDADPLGLYDSQRPNPPIEAGSLRSLSLSLEHGKAYRPWSLFAYRRVRAQAEYAKDVLGGDFDFAQYQVIVDWHLRTILKRRSPPNALDLRFVASTASGDLPVQRFVALDARGGLFSPFGGFRSLRDGPYEGERSVAVFWEQYLRTIPFEVLGLQSLADRGIGLILHGASGRTWIGRHKRQKLGFDPTYATSFHHEAGVSLILSHILRIDVVRRIDRAEWSVGMSLARLDFFDGSADRP